MGALAGGGAMVAVAASEAEVAASLAGVGGRVSVAAVNGPGQVVISGAEEAVLGVAGWWRERGVRVRRLRVSHGFHSPLMDPALAALAEAAGRLTLVEPVVPVVSGVTGEVLTTERAGSAGYWVDQARQPVRFADVVGWLAGQGVGVFTELGPDGALSALGPGCLPEDSSAVWVPALRPGRDEPATALLAAGELFVRGTDVDWAGLLDADGGQRADLPTYAFMRQQYWPRPQPAPVVPVGADGGVEQGRFWAAVEAGDVAAAAQAVGADERARASLGGILPVLSAWRRGSQQRSVVDRWLYRVTWQPVADPGPAVLAGRWLVVVPPGDAAGELGGACITALGAHGAQAVVLEAGPDLDRAALAARIRDVLSGPGADDSGASPDPAAGGGVAGVVSLLAVDEGPGEECSEVAAGVAGTLALVQALSDVRADAPLWVLTQGAVAAGPDEQLGSPVQAQVWGLGRVAALEYPQRWGGLIDVPPRLTGRAGQRLCGLLAGAGEHLAAEDQLAIRKAGVLARRLVRATLPRDGGQRGGAGRSAEWAASGTTLVTGGTGALGGQLVRWVAERGAARVVLASRRGPAAPGMPQLAASLAGTGTVVVAGCDVADKAALAGLLAWLAATGPAVTAVFHAAGVLDDGIVDGLSPRRLAGVRGPKAGAAWHLHELTAGLALDAFVLFSSMAGSVGAEGQGNYAAANAFLDALAEYRRGRGLPAASVAWGPWAGGGMSEGGGAERARRGGVRAMAPELAVLALGQILQHGETAITVADVDWDLFGPAFTSVRPSALFCEIPEARRAVAAEREGLGGGEPGALLAGRLVALGEAEQEQVMLGLVRALAARVLGHASADAVDVQGKFIEMGFTSLGAVELRSLLAATTGLRLPTTTVFDYPTPTALAGFLRAQLAVSVAPDRVDTAQADDPAPRISSAAAEPSGGLSSLFDQANRDGRGGEFLQAMRSIAAFRPSFDARSEFEVSTNLLQISQGTAQPRLICFPSFIGRSSPYQYARLASTFNGIRDVAVVAIPGFVERERLAASKDDMVEVHGRTVQRYAGTAPFVLLGHSAGGLIAQHVACRLESLGVFPAALVLIEVYSPDDWDSQQRVHTEVMTEMLQVNEERAATPGGDAWVTAMARYSSFDWWNLPVVATPTLLVRASENVTEPSGDDQRGAWRFGQDVTVMHTPGNHFTVISDDADSTARAVDGWLKKLP